jgi:hypothetical protein
MGDNGCPLRFHSERWLMKRGQLPLREHWLSASEFIFVETSEIPGIYAPKQPCYFGAANKADPAPSNAL